MKVSNIFIFRILYVLAFSSSCNLFADHHNNTPHTSDINFVKSLLTGTWNSPEWRYGFRIAESSGHMTTWNNDYNPDDLMKKGDVILKITEFTENGFKGVHTFYDGSLIDVVATIIDKNTIELSGRREIWEMYREVPDDPTQ